MNSSSKGAVNSSHTTSSSKRALTPPRLLETPGATVSTPYQKLYGHGDELSLKQREQLLLCE